MHRRVIPFVFLVAYAALLIKVMVFKDIPTIRVGHMMFRFGGTDAGHSANFIPFKTIGAYVFGNSGLLIAGINVVGNVGLLVPVGFVLPFVFRTMTWKSAFASAVASGLMIEVLQVVLHVGIFDIDDVILNALGVVIGYGVYVLLIRNRFRQTPGI